MKDQEILDYETEFECVRVMLFAAITHPLVGEVWLGGCRVEQMNIEEGELTLEVDEDCRFTFIDQEVVLNEYGEIRFAADKRGGAYQLVLKTLPRLVGFDDIADIILPRA